MAQPELAARAVWFAAPRTVEIRPDSAPPPGPGEVRVRTLVSAISHGTERLVYRGEVPADLPLDLPTLAGSFAFPIKYGYAAVGRVVDVGRDVPSLASGDVVFVLQPHQTVFTAPAALAVRLPAGLDPLLGTFVANLETAIGVVHDTPLRLGETALVFGQGTVGCLVAQLIRRAGAGRVIAVDPRPARRERAIRAGADAALAPGPDLRERVRALNGGRDADVAVEASGAPAALAAAIECVAAEGTVVVAAWYGTKLVPLPLGGSFHRGRLRLRSSQVGQLNPELAPRWDRDRRRELAVDLLARLHLRELISHQIPFEQAAEAYRLVDGDGPSAQARERPDGKSARDRPEEAGEIGQIVLIYA